MSQTRNSPIEPFDDSIPLEKLQAGQPFHAYVLAVRSVTSKTTRDGKTYLELKLADESDCRIGKIWDVGDEDIAKISKADFLEVYGQIETNEKFAGELKIYKWNLTPRPSDIAKFIQKPAPKTKQYWDRFTKLLTSIKDPELRSVLKEIFSADEDTRTKFYRAYAAGNMHHAFPGGLLEHTVEVAELASNACDVLNGLDRDLLVTGAILHDFGKLEEMDHELKAGQYTDDGCLIGHIIIGTIKISKAIDEINSRSSQSTLVRDDTRRALIHLILSHHGIPEHGTARKPASAEAAILWLCDNMSAKSRQYQDFIDENRSSSSQVYNRSLDLYVYTKSMRTGSALQTTDATENDFADLNTAFANTEFVTSVSLPILGRVAAGEPDEKTAFDVPEMRNVVPPRDGADFLLCVTGDSMIDAGIREGDLLFVKNDTSPNDGDIVVAHIDGEGQTVKFLRLSETPHLDPANPKYSPIPVTESTQIQGKVTGLLRDI